FRMNFRSVLFITIVGLLLVSSLEAAKAGKGKKGSREVKSVEKGAKVEKKVQKDKTVKAEKGEVVVLEEPAVIGGLPTPKIYRPKHLKVSIDESAETIVFNILSRCSARDRKSKIVKLEILNNQYFKVVTAYDKCKADCKKIVDQQDLASYAMQLREELAAAEAALEAA
ncbi:hypothetical protein PENTCL1PPCAC_14510, partial [Pristionchus entomophagus]